MGRHSVFGMSSHTWEVFPHMFSLPKCGKASRIWDDFPCSGSLPMYGKSPQTWDFFNHIGSLPRYGKSSRIWDVFPNMGNLPMHGKSSHAWQDRKDTTYGIQEALKTHNLLGIRRASRGPKNARLAWHCIAPQTEPPRHNRFHFLIVQVVWPGSESCLLCLCKVASLWKHTPLQTKSSTPHARHAATQTSTLPRNLTPKRGPFWGFDRPPNAQLAWHFITSQTEPPRPDSWPTLVVTMAVPSF